MTTKNGEKPHVSWSQIRMLNFCGEQYRRRYVEGEIFPPGISLLVGRATDASVSSNLIAKRDKKELLPLEEVQSIARDKLIAEWRSGGVALTEDEVEKGSKKVRGEAIDKAVRLSSLHAKETAPRLEPTHVQRKWRIELKGYPADVIGYTDVQEGDRAVRDTKTAAKTPNKHVADKSDQLTLYALASLVIDGVAPGAVVFDYLIDNKTPIAKTFESTRDLVDFRVFLRRLENALLTIEKAAFVPVNRDHWGCSPRFCGYWHTCPYVRNPNSVGLAQLKTGRKTHGNDS